MFWVKLKGVFVMFMVVYLGCSVGWLFGVCVVYGVMGLILICVWVVEVVLEDVLFDVLGIVFVLVVVIEGLDLLDDVLVLVWYCCEVVLVYLCWLLIGEVV